MDSGAVANGLVDSPPVPVDESDDVLFENMNPVDLVYGRRPDGVGMTVLVETMVDKTLLE